MKKTYRKPDTHFVQLQQRSLLLDVSRRSLNNNVGLNYSDLGSSGEAHSRCDDMDDWEDWEDWEDDEIEEYQ